MTNYSLDEPYISIYDRPQRLRGRPKIYTDDQLKERRKEISKKHYENNRDYYLLQKYLLRVEQGKAKCKKKSIPPKTQKIKKCLINIFFDFL